MGKANELTFQNDMIRQLLANGWLLGFAQDTQRQKFCKLYPNNPEQKFLNPDTSARTKAMRYIPIWA